MQESLGSRLAHAWNVFNGKQSYNRTGNIGSSFNYRPDKSRFFIRNQQSIINSVHTRIAIDCSALNVNHVQLDDNGRFTGNVQSGLNHCLSVEANIDQTGRAFIQDVIMSMMDEGCVAVVPVEADLNPIHNMSYDIGKLRTGKILEWYPSCVKLEVYNEKKGIRENVVMPKKNVCIIENPLYSIMNEHNSTAQRLIRKLAILDVIDEQSGSGKLDLVIQLPYVIKTEAKRAQAEQRRAEIEAQLTGSKYGIAYTDGTEKIIQLNRPIDNNLMSQIEYLTEMLYSQLGITKSILDGTADENTMLNYYNRTVEPIISALVDEIKRKFLTSDDREEKKQSVVFFRDPFKLIPIGQIAEISDTFTRNEIMTANEVRQKIGMKPVDDPKADELRNSNLSESSDEIKDRQLKNLVKESKKSKNGRGLQNA